MKKLLLAIAAAVLFGFSLMGADKLAIADPVGKNGVSEKEISGVGSILEASVDGGYDIISRSALNQMLVEMKLSSNSGLMDMSSEQMAQLGKIYGVKYLLITNISRLGNRLNISMMVINSSTGKIDNDRRTNAVVEDLNEFNDKLTSILEDMGLDRKVKRNGKVALLRAVVQITNPKPFVGPEYDACMESTLLSRNIRIQNVKSLDNILVKNKLDSPDNLEPAMYRRLGELLRVDYMISTRIDRMQCSAYSRVIESTRQSFTQWIGEISGTVRVIDTHTGEVIASAPFQNRIDFSDLPFDTDNWSPEEYARYVIRSVIPGVSEFLISKIK